MSAYMVDREHIQFLVSAAQCRSIITWMGNFQYYWNGESHYVPITSRDAATRMGQVLWDENLKSINARYPDTVGKPENCPGPVDETFIYAHSKDWPGEIKPVQVLKAIACLRYQSCEHDGWEKSEAFPILAALENAAIHALPGYENAAWGAPELKKEVR